jgi:hypothetical protein
LPKDRNASPALNDLLGIAAKDSAAYKGVPLVSLIAYSLYWIHQWELRPTFEAVTVLSWRLFPTAFSLVGFHQLPDAARTNRSLLQGQPKYRNVLTGTPTRGYHLNSRGAEIAQSLIKALGVPEYDDGTALGSASTSIAVVESPHRRTISPARDVEKIRSSRLFQKWLASDLNTSDVIHVHSLLAIFDHTPSKERQRAYKDLMTSAQQVDDTEIVRFLEAIRELFPKVFASDKN